MLNAAWVGFVFLTIGGVAWVAYLTGRDTAEAACQSTIATLRSDLRESRLETRSLLARGESHPSQWGWSPEREVFDPRLSRHLNPSSPVTSTATLHAVTAEDSA
jgi:hypothetical protein